VLTSVCMWSGRCFACSDDIYEIERRDSCQQRVFIWREMHGRLGSESPRELSHGSFSRSLSLRGGHPPAHLSSACGPPWCSCECSLSLCLHRRRTTTGDTKPTKKGAQTNICSKCRERGHQPKTLNLTTPHQNINFLIRRNSKYGFVFVGADNIAFFFQ
jgi:hypothetical protein